MDEETSNHLEIARLNQRVEEAEGATRRLFLLVLIFHFLHIIRLTIIDRQLDQHWDAMIQLFSINIRQINDMHDTIQFVLDILYAMIG